MMGISSLVYYQSFHRFVKTMAKVRVKPSNDDESDESGLEIEKELDDEIDWSHSPQMLAPLCLCVGFILLVCALFTWLLLK